MVQWSGRGKEGCAAQQGERAPLHAPGRASNGAKHTVRVHSQFTRGGMRVQPPRNPNKYTRCRRAKAARPASRFGNIEFGRLQAKIFSQSLQILIFSSRLGNRRQPATAGGSARHTRPRLEIRRPEVPAHAPQAGVALYRQVWRAVCQPAGRPESTGRHWSEQECVLEVGRVVGQRSGHHCRGHPHVAVGEVDRRLVAVPELLGAAGGRAGCRVRPR